MFIPKDVKWNDRNTKAFVPNSIGATRASRICWNKAGKRFEEFRPFRNHEWPPRVFVNAEGTVSVHLYIELHFDFGHGTKFMALCLFPVGSSVPELKISTLEYFPSSLVPGPYGETLQHFLDALRNPNQR